MSEPNFSLELELPVPPTTTFAAWLDPQQHGAMTGAPATRSEDGHQFTAWDGYIQGEYLNITAPEGEIPGRISMYWRTLDFSVDSCDARVVVEFAPSPGGTRLILRQYETPADQGDRYVDGWKEYYFAPMLAYFGGLSA
jgi:uncharacterized protein YndB with AHSA1/START domain